MIVYANYVSFLQKMIFILIGRIYFQGHILYLQGNLLCLFVTHLFLLVIVG